MPTLNISAVSDENGDLLVKIPAGDPKTPFEVTVDFRKRQGLSPPPPDRPGEDDRPVSDEFIERTAGAWIGPFERPPQGKYEAREPL